MQAKVVSLQPKELTLDREWQGSKQVPFEYLVAATGTRLASPGTMPSDEKVHAVDYLKQYNQGIKNSKSVLIIGGGAVGVQSKPFEDLPPPTHIGPLTTGSDCVSFSGV